MGAGVGKMKVLQPAALCVRVVLNSTPQVPHQRGQEGASGNEAQGQEDQCRGHTDGQCQVCRHQQEQAAGSEA